jgi:hypothetical protein
MADEQDMGPVEQMLRASLGEARIGPVDAAAAKLAQVYAQEIDRAGDLAKLGPQFLKVLEQLQMTPRSRAQAQRGGPGEPAAARSPLDELRARRDRKHGAPPMDPTAP